MTIVHPRSLEQATVRSLVADSLGACSAQRFAGLAQPLEALRKAHPEDLSVATCRPPSAGVDDAAAAFERPSNNWPPRPKDAAGPAPGRCQSQRTRAGGRRAADPALAGRRECRRGANPSTVLAIGDRLAARALEAARRQNDRVWLLAMMREQGQAAFDRTDRTQAARVWSRMLELVVTPTEARARRPAGGNRAGGAAPARAGGGAGWAVTGLVLRRPFPFLTYL